MLNGDTCIICEKDVNIGTKVSIDKQIKGTIMSFSNRRQVAESR